MDAGVPVILYYLTNPMQICTSEESDCYTDLLDKRGTSKIAPSGRISMTTSQLFPKLFHLKLFYIET